MSESNSVICPICHFQLKAICHHEAKIQTLTRLVEEGIVKVVAFAIMTRPSKASDNAEDWLKRARKEIGG